VKKSWLFVLLSLCAAGCKQGRGERCQVEADCAAGLICKQSDPKVCDVVGGDGAADANPAIDAPPIDAP